MFCLAAVIAVLGSATFSYGSSAAFHDPHFATKRTYSKQVAFVTPRKLAKTKHNVNRRQRACRQAQWPIAWPPRRSQQRNRRGGPLAAALGKDGGEEDQSAAMGEEDGVFIPTEELLQDPSHVNRIMANMAKLLPPVPGTDGGIFKRAVSHHCALRTSNIIRAMKFYSLLGMNEVVRFRADTAKCAFLEGAGMRLELIEVPATMQPPNKAADLSVDMRSTGLNHVAFDVGPAIEAEKLGDMKGFLTSLNRQSEKMFGMSVRLVVSPYEQLIGQDVFELAFIMDADGILLELVHKKYTLDTETPQEW